MANIKSQIKRIRQNEGRRVRNKGGRSQLRTHVKRFEDALASEDRAGAEELYRDAAKAFDKAASKGIIHRNKAANKKARLAKRLNSSG